MRRLLAAGLPALALAAACVDVHRGAIVQMNLKTLASNTPGQHYELFAVIGDGAVSLGRFKVLGAVSECGEDPLLTPNVQLVQAYNHGLDAAAQCDPDQRIGSIDLIDTTTARFVGGVRIDTSVDLRDADGLFLTVEQDGDADPRPAGPPVARADLAPGRDPLFERQAACLDRFCRETPAAERPQPDPCADRPEAPPSRRGVIVGTWVKAPVIECGEQEIGQIGIVPAEDETFL